MRLKYPGWGATRHLEEVERVLRLFGWSLQLKKSAEDMPLFPNNTFQDANQIHGEMFFTKDHGEISEYTELGAIVNQRKVDYPHWVASLWHETGHAVSDVLFYRGICQQSGFDWTVGFRGVRGAEYPEFLATPEGYPVQVNESEILASYCTEAVLTWLGAPAADISGCEAFIEAPLPSKKAAADMVELLIAATLNGQEPMAAVSALDYRELLDAQREQYAELYGSPNPDRLHAFFQVPLRLSALDYRKYHVSNEA